MRLNPRDLEKAMKQMGIKNEPVEAEEVVIRSKSKELVIKNPNVVRVTMGGQESFQITGDVQERSREPSQEDVEMVAAQAGVDEKAARASLEKTKGDIAQAILDLQQTE